MYARTIGVFTLVLLLATARANAQCNNDFILVSATDLVSSSSSTLNPVTKTATIGVEPLLNIAALRTFGGRVYAVLDDYRIQGLDPCNNFDPLFSPLITGNPSRPRDLVMVSPTLGYITRYDHQSLLKFNGTTFTGEITLAPYGNDVDFYPEMDQMFTYGGRLYVCLQRTDHTNGNPTGMSMLAVIALATETLVDMDAITGGIQGIPLLLQKPSSEINVRMSGGSAKAYFSAVGFTAVYDGGVIECEMADPFDQTVLLTEVNAGGDIVDVEIISDIKGFAIVINPTTTMELVAFNPSTGLKIGPTMLAVAGDNGFRWLLDMEPSSLGLLVADFNFSGPAGIRCFDMTTNAEIPGGPIGMGLPPFDILVRVGSTTDADHTPVATQLGQNYPNPFNPETSIPFALAKGGHVLLRVYDVNGRIVATLLDEHRDAGKHVARWEGTTNAGDVVPSGVYFTRLQVTGFTETKKLVLLK